MRQTSSAMTSASILSAVPTRLESGRVIPALMVSTALAAIGPTFKELAVVPARPVSGWSRRTISFSDQSLTPWMAVFGTEYRFYVHTPRDCSALLN
jgi:hypothetical protein